jgi:site-specific DNA-cytosine methylase
MGWEPAAFAEIESFPAAVLRHHYPNTPNLGDMTQWRTWNVGPIDLLVGGTPCQSFSVAGLRKGLSDPRGGLMLTFLEIAQSLRPRWVVWENVPGVLSSGGGRDFGAFLGALGELGYGWAYRVLDAQWCRVDGYERAVPQRRRRVFVVGCLGDQARAAQVLFERQSVERNPAARGKARQGAAADAEGGAESGGCYWDGSDCAATLTKQNAGGGQRMPDKANFGAVLQPARAWPAEVCSTLNASFGEKQRLEDQHALGGAPCFVPAVAGALDCNIPKQRVQNMTAGHWLAVPIHDKATRHEGATGRGSGNGLGIGADGDPSPTLTSGDKYAVAMAVNVSNGEPRVADVMGTLDAARESRGTNQQRFVMEPFRKSHRASSATEDGTGRGVPLTVAHGFYSTGGTHGVNMEPEASPAVKVGSGLGIPSPPAVAFKPSHFTRGKDGSPADITPPLSADADKGDQDTVVAYPIDGRNAMRDPEKHDEINRQGVGVENAGDPSHTVTSAAVHAVAVAPSLTSFTDAGQGQRIRDTADESETLRATKRGPFSDYYATQMVVRRLTPVECERLQGFPDDYTNIPWRGKTESPDGPRYKALGNSMAVNCMRWIGRRIDAVEKGAELPA